MNEGGCVPGTTYSTFVNKVGGVPGAPYNTLWTKVAVFLALLPTIPCEQRYLCSWRSLQYLVNKVGCIRGAPTLHCEFMAPLNLPYERLCSWHNLLYLVNKVGRVPGARSLHYLVNKGSCVPGTTYSTLWTKVAVFLALSVSSGRMSKAMSMMKTFFLLNNSWTMKTLHLSI